MVCRPHSFYCEQINGQYTIEFFKSSLESQSTPPTDKQPFQVEGMYSGGNNLLK